MSSARVIGGLVHEVNEPELGRTKESLEFRRVDDITFEIIECDLTPDFVLKFVNVREYALPLCFSHFDSPSSVLRSNPLSFVDFLANIIRLSRSPNSGCAKDAGG